MGVRTPLTHQPPIVTPGGKPESWMMTPRGSLAGPPSPEVIPQQDTQRETYENRGSLSGGGNPFGADVTMFGGWFIGMQESILKLISEMSEVKNTIKLLAINEESLRHLEENRTGKFEATGLVDQILELQKIVMRGVAMKKAAELLTLSKTSDNPLRARYFKKLFRNMRQRQSALILLSGSRTVLLSMYFKKLMKIAKYQRVPGLLLRSKLRILNRNYQAWVKYAKRHSIRAKLARTLAFANANTFVTRYFGKLYLYYKEVSRSRYEALQLQRYRTRVRAIEWLCVMSQKRLLRRGWAKLLLHADGKKIRGPPQQFLIGMKEDERSALAHALAMSNNNLIRNVFYKRWKGWRWLLKRGDIASRVAVIRERELLEKYAERLRKYGTFGKMSRMTNQLEANLEGLSKTNQVLDRVVERLVTVEDRVEAIGHHSPNNQIQIPIQMPTELRNISPNRREQQRYQSDVDNSIFARPLPRNGPVFPPQQPIVTPPTALPLPPHQVHPDLRSALDYRNEIPISPTDHSLGRILETMDGSSEQLDAMLRRISGR